MINATKIKKGLFQLVIENAVELEIGYMLYLYNDSAVDSDSFCHNLGIPNGFFGIIKDIDKVEKVILIDVEYDKNIDFDMKRIERVVLYEKTPLFINI